MTFGIVDLIVLIGLAQGVYLIFALARIKNRNNLANIYLILFLIATLIMFIGRLMLTKELTVIGHKAGTYVDGVIFLFGPLLYGYIRQSTFAGTYNLRWFHFIPFAAQMIKGIYISLLPDDIFMNMVINWSFPAILQFSGPLGLALNIGYLIASFFILIKYSKNEKSVLSFRQETIKYLKAYLSVTAFCLVCWLYSFLAWTVFNFNPGWINYNSVWLGISISTYVIGYYISVHPQIFRIPQSTSKEKKTSIRLSPIESESLRNRIDELLEQEKIYLNSNLTLQDLAKKVNASTNDVSWLLNNVLHTNFYDFINQRRTLEFIRKLDNDEHLSKTLLGLAYEVGFNSKSTFNRAFKQETNQNPSDYIKRTKFVA